MSLGRNRVADTTSVLNFDEEHRTPAKEVNAVFVYVLNCQGRCCFVFGRRSSGYFDLRSLDGTKIHASASYKKLVVIQKASATLVERRAAFPPVT